MSKDLEKLISNKIEKLSNKKRTKAQVQLLEDLLKEYKEGTVRSFIPTIVKNDNYSSFIKDFENSKLAKTETNDCVVKTVAACFDFTYDEAHAWVKENCARKNRRGTYNSGGVLVKTKELNGKTIKPLKNLTFKQPNGNVTKLTLRRFLASHPKGTYAVYVRKHAFAVIDGVVVGNYSDPRSLRKIVRGVLEIK